MQNTSALYREIIAREDHYFETSVVLGDNGALVTEFGDRIKFGGDTIVVARTNAESGFLENQLFSVKTSNNMFSDNPEIGKAVSGEIDISMIKPSGEIPRMGVVVPYVRVCADVSTGSTIILADEIINQNAQLNGELLVFGNDVSVANNYLVFASGYAEKRTSEWLQQGVYYIDTRESSHNDDDLTVLTFHGYDAMLFAEQDYARTNLDWPAVDTDIVNEIAGMMEISVDPRTWDIMTGGYTLPLPTNYSLREILGYIASMYLGSFIITEKGELRLVTLLELPAETRYLIDQAGYAITFGGDRIKV